MIPESAMMQRRDLVDSLYRRGQVVVGKNEHWGNTSGPRGAHLAHEIEVCVKRYMRASGVDKPYMRVFGSAGNVTVCMDRGTHMAFRSLVERGYL